MAEIPITINGVICDLYGRTITGPVKIVGSLMKSGLSVGGGPIFPPEGGSGPGDPTHIWGPTDPRPTPPIANVPGIDNPNPPGWGDGPPEQPPADGMVKPPPEDGGWGYHPDYGWGYYPGPGQPQPKK